MIYCIMGPTASGKSALALETALKLNGEIISADSMQCYRGLEIGTAQPTADERKLVPHHLVGFAGYSERIDVFRFVEMAQKCIADIERRGKVPVIAGGTGFYIKALLYGLDDLPGDPELRRQLDSEYDRDDAMDALRERMRELDPAGEARWHDCRRKLIRALEVRLISGKSILELQTGERKLRCPVKSIVLNWPPELLRERIVVRTDEMLARGWIEEAEKAIADGVLDGPTSHQALGYSVIGRYLNNEIDFKTMRERIIIETGQLARRQRTWFRHQHPEAEIADMPVVRAMMA